MMPEEIQIALEISDPFDILDLDDLAEYCKNNPEIIKHKLSYDGINLSYDQLDIIVGNVFEGSVKELLNFFNYYVMRFNIFDYIYNRTDDISIFSRVRIRAFSLSEDDICKILELLSTIPIEYIKLCYYNLFVASVGSNQPFYLIEKIIDNVGIDELVNMMDINTKIYDIAIMYNIKLEHVFEIYSLTSGCVWTKQLPNIIGQIADKYGYEYGLKILLMDE